MKIFRWFLCVFFGQFCLIHSAFALTFGSYNVRSYLNQPLHVEVPISNASNFEPEDIQASLANEFYFQLSKLKYQPIYQDLDFDVRIREGDLFLNIESQQHITEPLLKFIMLINWPNDGCLLREMTLTLETGQFSDTLLQNADMLEFSPIVSVGPLGAIESAEFQSFESITLSPVLTKPIIAEPLKENNPTGGQYMIKRGDTLWGISMKFAPDINPQKTTIAIMQINQHALIKENMHRIRPNVWITLPSLDEIDAISAALARKLYIEHENRLLAQ